LIRNEHYSDFLTHLARKNVGSRNIFGIKTKIISLKIKPNTYSSTFLFAEIRIVRIFATSNPERLWIRQAG